ncbi:flagellar protein FlgN [Clostridium sp. MSJ-8]|uniref:flagellar protein FlgN n=1 Tax=Clostridium sp. MSJ-8 TaxID=2841510 RepID=UPI001C0EF654|nr:flagellar protein FlgN [Clostridium sp. MSJ-8]MBU5488444.1 flagellar protein FlgN [Clostridium sp. MSJ-8]
MNYEQLAGIIGNEEVALKKLLGLLDRQYQLIMKKEVFELEGIVDEIKACNKEVAEIEIERRKILGSESVKDVVKKSKNKNLEEAYRSINSTLFEVKLQKDTNELLIKQQISFATNMLNIINPRRDVTTYNSYGNIKR